MTGWGKAAVVVSSTLSWFMGIGFLVTVVSVIVILIAAGSRRPSSHPAPAPWSCASVNADVSVLDAGGQIAPVCGNTPYPDAPADDGG